MSTVENRLFVNNVPPTATTEDLLAHFSQFGPTQDVYLPRVFGTTRNKGIAYITFDHAETKDLALKHPYHTIHGQQVTVQHCLAKGHGKGTLPGTSVTMSGDRLFISGISQEATQDEVQAYFAQYGSWTDIFMPRGSFTAGHKGICFISYTNPASVGQVLQSAPHIIHGQQVVVDVAAPRDAKGGGKGPHMLMSAAMQVAAAPAATYGHGAIARAVGPWGALAVPPQQQQRQQQQQQQPFAVAGAVMPGRLFLTKMSPGISKDDLSNYFQQFGALNDVYIPPGGKLIAFIGYADPSVSSAVAQMQTHEVKPGCFVNAEAAVERPPLGGGAKGQGKVRFNPY